MKHYTHYGYVKNPSKVLGYSFMVKISLMPKLYQLEVNKMRRLLKEECEKLGWSHFDLVLYKDLVVDRRSDRSVPKGYRQYRFGYALRTNVIYVPKGEIV